MSTINRIQELSKDLNSSEIQKELSLGRGAVNSVLFYSQIPQEWSYQDRAALGITLWKGNHHKDTPYSGNALDERGMATGRFGMCCIRLARMWTDHQNEKFQYNWDLSNPLQPRTEQTHTPPDHWILFGFGPAHATVLIVPNRILERDQKSISAVCEPSGVVKDSAAYSSYIRDSELNPQVARVFRENIRDFRSA